MQSYGLKLTTNNTDTIQINANGFWYESGASALDSRIIITPEGGSDIVLKSGQSVRINGAVRSWNVRKFNDAAQITGNIVIGTGEFSDNNANINGTMSVLGTVAIDTTAGRVKVEDTVLETNKILYIDGTSATPTLSAGSLSYVGSIVTAAENIKGILLQKFLLKKNTYNGKLILCLTDAANEAWSTNKKIIEVFDLTGLAAGTVITLQSEIKIPAGKFLSLQTEVASTQYVDKIHVLMSILT